MATRPENVVADIGKRLAQQSRPTKDFLVKYLRQAETALSELEQLSSLKPFIRPLSQSLAKHGLLQHKDKDVKVLVAVCFCEIIRVLAPDPSFGDKVFKDIFELFIGMFMELADTRSPYFSRRVKILETVAKLECCRQMLDLGCDDLILKMFKTFFSVVREEHQQGLTKGMLSIMSLILNEEEITQPLLEVILQNLRIKGEGPAPASYNLAVDLIQNCEEKIKPTICGFLTSCILDRETVRSELKECYHDIIFRIFQCTPHMLLGVIPSLVQELLTDQVDVRLKSVNLLGKLLTLPKDHDIHEHNYLFVELLKRFSDKSAEVRISVIRAVKACYMANPSGTESHKILSSLETRLLDFDTSVRMEAVAVVCDLARSRLKNFPEVLIARATDRLRDKMPSVRKEALRKLLEVYREYCTQCYEGQMMLKESYEQILCKILVHSFDKNLKEFRPQNLELLIAKDMFPASLPVEDRMRHWIYLYSLFTPAHVKALNLLLCQKRRFQTEMQGYLSLRRKGKGIDSEEGDMRIKNALTRMSAAFPNPVKAEECFYKLNQLKDTGIFDPLLQLLGEPTNLNAEAMRDNFLKNVGDKHPLVEFLEALSLKCSHNIFSSEHVVCILDHVCGSRCRDNGIEESFNLLSDIVRNFPLLLRGSEHQFKMLMLEDSWFCGKLVQILAKVGAFLSLELREIYPILEKFCLEGTRTESKAAVSAIAALVGPSDQFLLVDLCQKLVESLHGGWNIPTVLQSLGCIAQHSILAFQKQEHEVLSYIKEKFFEDEMTEETDMFDEESGCDVSFNCRVKIYGLKTLVKSILPRKETHRREGVTDLLEILSRVLVTGEFANAATVSEIDMAHIRLAAAKSVLRLSSRWDLHISPQMFQATIMMAKDASSFVRKTFLDKTHKLLREHAVSSKFACAFALASMDCVKDLQDASLKYLVEFIEEYGRASRTCPTSGAEGFSTDSPAYIVVFLLHILVHDAGFPPVNSHSEELFAHFCRPLVLVMRLLVNSRFVDGDSNLVNEIFLYLRTIFKAIKRAEDAVDPEKTPKLHMLADIGISVLDVLKHDGISVSLGPGLVLLPSSLYRSSMSRNTKEDNCCPIELVSNEDFVRKLVRIVDSDFSQFSSATVKSGRKCLKDCFQDQHTVNLNISKQVGLSTNVTRLENVAVKEMTETRVLEACPKRKEKTPAVRSSLGTVQSQDISSAMGEIEADGSGNLESIRAKDHKLDSKSANLELFGTESDVSTQDDISLTVSQQDQRKRNSSCGSEESSELSKTKLRYGGSSDGSTVSFLQHCNPSKQSCEKSVKQRIATAAKGAAEVQGTTGGSKRKILLDRTNSLAVDGLRKLDQPKKSCTGNLEKSVSDVTQVDKDVIALRTRRRKV